MVLAVMLVLLEIGFVGLVLFDVILKELVLFVLLLVRFVESVEFVGEAGVKNVEFVEFVLLSAVELVILPSKLHPPIVSREYPVSQAEQFVKSMQLRQ